MQGFEVVDVALFQCLLLSIFQKFIGVQHQLALLFGFLVIIELRYV